MFEIALHEEGFSVTWPLQQEADAHVFRAELILAGLGRARDSATRLVVQRYRNELETLQVLTEMLSRLGIAFALAPELEAARNVGQAEQELIELVRRNSGRPPRPVAATIPEFGP